MYPVKVNDTRYPGLQGRILHDTVNLDNSISNRVAFSEVRVNATEMNIHCSQVTDATIDVFTLAQGSSNFSAGNFANSNGVVNYNFSNDASVWINFKMPPPPYWNPNVPGLNFTAKWEEFLVVQTGLSTRVMFQPWAWEGKRGGVPGHQQVVMVIATSNLGALLKDSSGTLGKVQNFTISPGQPCTQTICPKPFPGYIQAIGCTSRADNLTATISREGLLLDPPTDLRTSEFPNTSHDHPWDDFVWEEQNVASPVDRQLLFAFTPSSSYNVTPIASFTRYKEMAINGNVENLVAAALLGETVNIFNDHKMNLPEFQAFLEHLFASYLWNTNRLCNPLDSIYYCGSYWEPYSSADFVLRFPSVVMEVVLWRAILSMICSTFMCLLAYIILGIKSDRPNNTPLRNGSLLSVAKLMRDSSIPEVVATQSVKKTNEPDSELVKSLMEIELSYGPNSDLNGYNLDVLDHSHRSNADP